MIRKFAFATLALVAFAGGSQASTVDGTVSIIADAISANGATLGTSTQFTFDMLTGSGRTGDFLTPIPFPAFTSLGSQIVFDTTNGLSFSNASFGSFSTISVIPISITPNAVSYYVLGTYMPGSFFDALLGAPPHAEQQASLTIQFNQTQGGAIGGGGSFATPPAPIVPEPSTIATALLGLGFAGFAARRRLAK